MKLRKSIIILLPSYLMVLVMMIFFAKASSNVVTTFAENKPISNRRIVVIDAGHGGIDGGTTSVSGVTESHINLEIALKLQDMFHLLGIKTLMIRTEDVSVYTSGNTIATKKVSDLKERVRIVNSQENCILLSIHQNYFSDGRYKGAQVFYSPKGEGEKLAGVLQNILVKQLNPGSSRKSKPADGVYLMQHVNCTGVLVECGFLSNPDEDRLLQSKEYQIKMSSIIASVVASYMNT